MITSRSSGDNGCTWSERYAEDHLSDAISRARAWTLNDPNAMHVVQTPLSRYVVREGRIERA